MPDVKITELGVRADAASTDVLAIVDLDTDVTKKVTVDELLQNAGDGTAATPAFSFDSDPNTGLYLEAPDKLGIATQGTGHVFIDATGQVGIGDSTPSSTLDVTGTGAFSSGLTVGGSNVVTAGDTSTVTSTMIADDAVGADQLANTAVTAGSYTAADITVDAQGRITAAASGEIGTAEIANDAVTPEKLEDTSVTAGTYAAADITVDAQGRITAAASGAIGTNEIEDDAVDGSKLSDTGVTAGSYTAADITVDAQGRITSAASGTIGTSEIADNAVNGDKLADNITIANNLTVTNNLIVNGTTSTINSTTVQVDDKNIELGTVANPTDVTADGGGITLKGATDHTITWTNSTDSWDFSEHVNIASAKEFRIGGTKVLDATSLGSSVVSSSLTSVGTIGTGVWNGTPIAAAYLANTAVTAGTYTAASITVDAQGRLTSASSNTIPTNNNQLTNGAGYTTFDGDYNSLTNTPTIPTNNNQLTNGAGYITSADGGNADTVDNLHASSFVRTDSSSASIISNGNIQFNDSISLRFGSGNDTMFYYDGSDMYFDFETAGDNFYYRDVANTTLLELSESTGNLSLNKGSLNVGDGGDQSTVQIKKADNNVSDHIQFYNGTTRVGEIGCEDGTWLRINQETPKNIYTPRYMRADGGFFVHGSTKGIDSSGNFIGGTIAGASDYGTLLRSDANDTASGEISFTSGIKVTGSFSTDTQASELVIEGATPQITFTDTDSGSDDFYIHVNTNNFYVLADRDGVSGPWDSPHPLQLKTSDNTGLLFGDRILTVADEGSGNGLDADTLDGQEGSYYLDYNNFTNTPTIGANAQLQGYEDYELLIDFASDAAGTERRILSAALASQIYSTIAFQIDVVDNTSNQAPSSKADANEKSTYYVYCSRADATTLNSPDSVTVTGPTSGDLIRARKISQGNYEVTIRNTAQYREYRISIKVIGVNGSHTITYRNGDTPSTATASYTSSASSTNIDYFQAVTADSYTGNGSALTNVNATTLDSLDSTQFLRSDAADTFSGDLTSSGSARLILKKTDNNVSDHIQFFNGTTRVGEIGCESDNFLEINKETANNIFTPRYIRADGGFFVDGTTKGINGSGNFVGGTIAGASDYVDDAATANTVAGRNASGDIHARLIRQTYANQSTISGGMVFRVNNTNDNYLRVCSNTSAIRTYLGVNEAGSIPQKIVSQLLGYALQATDVGKHIYRTNGSDVSVVQNRFSTGDAITIYNAHSSSISINEGTNVTLRIAGSSSTGDVTLSAYGLCTLLCVDNGTQEEFIVSGTGVS